MHAVSIETLAGYIAEDLARPDRWLAFAADARASQLLQHWFPVLLHRAGVPPLPWQAELRIPGLTTRALCCPVSVCSRAQALRNLRHWHCAVEGPGRAVICGTESPALREWLTALVQRYPLLFGRAESQARLAEVEAVRRLRTLA